MPRFDRATVDVRVAGVNPYGPVTYRIRVDDLEELEFVLTEAQLPWQLMAMAQVAEDGIHWDLDSSEPKANAVLEGMRQYLRGKGPA